MRNVTKLLSAQIEKVPDDCFGSRDLSGCCDKPEHKPIDRAGTATAERINEAPISMGAKVVLPRRTKR